MPEARLQRTRDAYTTRVDATVDPDSGLRIRFVQEFDITPDPICRDPDCVRPLQLVGPMIVLCPVCGTLGEPFGMAGRIVLCAHCGATNVLKDTGDMRRATIHDIEALTTEQVVELRRLRSQRRG